MTIELGEKIATGNGENHRPLKEFYMLKTLPKGHVIEGIHQGRFESKKTPGYFFHVFKAADGEGYAYGTCDALDDRVKDILKKQEETGKTLYAKFTFNGRIPSKKNPKMTYYSFGFPELFEAKVSDAPADKSITGEDIPF